MHYTTLSYFQHFFVVRLAWHVPGLSQDVFYANTCYKPVSMQGLSLSSTVDGTFFRWKSSMKSHDYYIFLVSHTEEQNDIKKLLFFSGAAWKSVSLLGESDQHGERQQSLSLSRLQRFGDLLAVLSTFPQAEISPVFGTKLAPSGQSFGRHRG